jgi:hypothetical protein
LYGPTVTDGFSAAMPALLTSIVKTAKTAAVVFICPILIPCQETDAILHKAARFRTPHAIPTGIGQTGWFAQPTKLDVLDKIMEPP